MRILVAGLERSGGYRAKLGALCGKPGRRWQVKTEKFAGRTRNDIVLTESSGGKARCSIETKINAPLSPVQKEEICNGKQAIDAIVVPATRIANEVESLDDLLRGTGIEPPCVLSWRHLADAALGTTAAPELKRLRRWTTAQQDRVRINLSPPNHAGYRRCEFWTESGRNTGRYMHVMEDQEGEEMAAAWNDMLESSAERSAE